MEIKYIIIPFILIIFSVAVNLENTKTAPETTIIKEQEVKMDSIEDSYNRDSLRIIQQIEYNNYQLKKEIDKLKTIKDSLL